MTDHPGFLADIIANPNDDVARLVYADWLDDRGESERAAFIRAQVEWARTPGYREAGPDGIPDRNPRWKALYAQWHQLLRQHWGDWLPSIRASWTTTDIPKCGLVLTGVSFRDPLARGRSPRFDVAFRRGFVAEAACRLEDWIGAECLSCNSTPRLDAGSPGVRRCQHCHGTGRASAFGPLLAQRHCPLEWVTATDGEPNQTYQESDHKEVWAWWRDGYGPPASRLPECLWRVMVPPDGKYLLPWDRITVHTLDTQAAARTALSTACLRWAKAQPLPAEAQP